MMKKSDITISVGLNSENMPAEIAWAASGSPENSEFQPCKAMLLSLFDTATKDTLKIDLWTVDMQIGEMDRFFYQTLRGLADTYQRATQNKELANQMQQFATFFGEQVEMIPKEK